jgi:hypothetical protein
MQGRDARRMSFRTADWNRAISALEARDHLIQLQAERALALEAGLGEIDAYMTDLDAELADRRAIYIAAAVTEIATLRGELFGAQVG